MSVTMFEMKVADRNEMLSKIVAIVPCRVYSFCRVTYFEETMLDLSLNCSFKA
jgi:hypothetical protein